MDSWGGFHDALEGDIFDLGGSEDDEEDDVDVAEEGEAASPPPCPPAPVRKEPPFCIHTLTDPQAIHILHHGGGTMLAPGQRMAATLPEEGRRKLPPFQMSASCIKAGVYTRRLAFVDAGVVPPSQAGSYGSVERLRWELTMQLSVLRLLPSYSPADVVHHGVPGSIDSRYVFEMPGGEDKDADFASIRAPSMLQQSWESVPGVLPVGDRGGAVGFEFRPGRARRHTDVVPPRPPPPLESQRWTSSTLGDLRTTLSHRDSLHLVPLVPRNPSRTASTQTDTWKRHAATQTGADDLVPAGMEVAGMFDIGVITPHPVGPSPVAAGGPAGLESQPGSSRPSSAVDAQVRRSSRVRPISEPYWASGSSSRRRVDTSDQGNSP